MLRISFSGPGRHTLWLALVCELARAASQCVWLLRWVFMMKVEFDFVTPTILACFVLVRSYRSILSLFLLSAYALLLLHDFIPHSHHSHKQVVQVTGEDHHHHGDHHHSHDHSEEKDEDQNTPGASDNSSVLVSLIQTHSHSGFDGHQHNLVYRATAKDKVLSKVEVDICHSANQWRLPDRLVNGPVKHQASYWLLSSQFQTSSHGLRAPPALG